MLVFPYLSCLDKCLLFSSDTLQQYACRLIIGVLRNELALYCFLQDRLFQGFRECGVEGGDVFFCLAVSFYIWEEFFYLGYDAVLFGKRWDRNK